eukprot:30000_1
MESSSPSFSRNGTSADSSEAASNWKNESQVSSTFDEDSILGYLSSGRMVRKRSLFDPTPVSRRRNRHPLKKSNSAAKKRKMKSESVIQVKSPANKYDKKKKKAKESSCSNSHPVRRKATRRQLAPGEVRNCLALCMVYASEGMLRTGEGARQANRDYLRLNTMEKLGYQVYSVDSWHKTILSKADRHLQSSFRVPHRFMQSLDEKWIVPGSIPGVGGMHFDILVFDYFWMPRHWNKCWGSKIFSTLVPELASIYSCCDFWFPNDKEGLLKRMAEEASDAILDVGLRFELVPKKRAHECPLYAATAICDAELIKLPGKMCNNNQIEIYLMDDFPFLHVYLPE